jgi:hypothetical protein
LRVENFWNKPIVISRTDILKEVTFPPRSGGAAIASGRSESSFGRVGQTAFMTAFFTGSGAMELGFMSGYLPD